MRDGLVKSHIVFHAPYVLGLAQPEGSDAYRDALYGIAHEAGHVEVLKHWDEAFPGAILRPATISYENAILRQISDVLWEEYAACRGSAIFDETQTSKYCSGLTSVFRAARAQANAAISSYRIHGNIDRVLVEAGTPLCEPLRLLAYLTRHLDGLGQDFSSVPDIEIELAGSIYSGFPLRVRDVLRALWDRRGRWASRSEFDALKEIPRVILASGGLIFKTLPDGRLYVNIR